MYNTHHSNFSSRSNQPDVYIICPSNNSTISTLTTRSHISSWLNLSHFCRLSKGFTAATGWLWIFKAIEGPIVSKSSGTPGQNSNMQRVSGQMPTHLLCRLSSSWLQKPRLSTVVCVVGFDCWSVYSRAEYSCSYLLAHHLEHTDCHVCILLLLIDGCLHQLTKQMQLKRGTDTSSKHVSTWSLQRIYLVSSSAPNTENYDFAWNLKLFFIETLSLKIGFKYYLANRDQWSPI